MPMTQAITQLITDQMHIISFAFCLYQHALYGQRPFFDTEQKRLPGQMCI